ncbi:hypothetical protein GEMRC1_009851 [Eukaryota sp. GEM-RC1]
MANFLMTRQLTIFCDHKNIVYLINQPERNRIVTRWIPFLSNFSFQIIHVEGPNNVFADLLSRLTPANPSLESELPETSTCFSLFSVELYDTEYYFDETPTKTECPKCGERMPYLTMPDHIPCEGPYFACRNCLNKLEPHEVYNDDERRALLHLYPKEDTPIKDYCGIFQLDKAGPRKYIERRDDHIKELCFRFVKHKGLIRSLEKKNSSLRKLVEPPAKIKIIEPESKIPCAHCNHGTTDLELCASHHQVTTYQERLVCHSCKKYTTDQLLTEAKEKLKKRKTKNSHEKLLSYDGTGPLVCYSSTDESPYDSKESENSDSDTPLPKNASHFAEWLKEEIEKARKEKEVIDISSDEYEEDPLPSITYSVRTVETQDTTWLDTLRTQQQLELKDSSDRCSWDAEAQMFVTPDNKILVPESLRKEVMWNFHGYAHCGHPALWQCLKDIKNSCYSWPTLETDLKNHIDCCHSCQKTAPAPKTKTQSTGSLFAMKPFGNIHADTIGPWPTDNLGNRYVLVFVDAFTRYTILCPSDKISATNSAYCLINSVCANFGIPDMIHSDNGPEFCNATFKALCAFLNITNSFSLPHHHQSNGLVERRNREINQTLERFLLDLNDFQNWSTHLPMVQLMINNQRHSVTRCTPWELMFGSPIDPRKPASDLLDQLTAKPLRETGNVFVDALSARTTYLKGKWEEAARNQQSHLDKLRPNSKPVKNPFVIGDLVLRKNDQPQRLHGSWLGPVQVLESSPDSTKVKILNFVTGNELTTSSLLLRLFMAHSSNKEYLTAIAAMDQQESILVKVPDIDHRSNRVHVEWIDGSTSMEPLDEIRKTTAWSKAKHLHDDPL